MSKITVKYRGELRALTGCDIEELDLDTVRSVLRHIRERWGKPAEKEAKRMVIAVNGKSILLLNNEKTLLNDGDTVTFLPICGGG